MASTFHNIGWIILIVIFVSHGSSFPQTIAIQDTVTDSSPLGESSDPFDIVATDQTEAVLSQSDSDNDGLYPLADTSDCSPKNLGKRHVNDIQGGTWISKNPSAACDATIEGARRLGREPTRRAKPAPLPAIPSSRIQNKQLCPRGKFPKCCEFPASQIVLYKNAGYIIATCGSCMIFSLTGFDDWDQLIIDQSIHQDVRVER